MSLQIIDSIVSIQVEQQVKVDLSQYLGHDL